jgi:hypothetical protein
VRAILAVQTRAPTQGHGRPVLAWTGDPLRLLYKGERIGKRLLTDLHLLLDHLLGHEDEGRGRVARRRRERVHHPPPRHTRLLATPHPPAPRQRAAQRGRRRRLMQHHSTVTTTGLAPPPPSHTRRSLPSHGPPLFSSASLPHPGDPRVRRRLGVLGLAQAPLHILVHLHHAKQRNQAPSEGHPNRQGQPLSGRSIVQGRQDKHRMT